MTLRHKSLLMEMFSCRITNLTVCTFTFSDKAGSSVTSYEEERRQKASMVELLVEAFNFVEVLAPVTVNVNG